MENPNNWLFLESLRLVKGWKPEWVVFENVKGIAETEKAAFLKMMISGLESCGYTVTWWKLNAADYGVPQMRYRLFVIGSLHGVKIEMPTPTVSKSITVGSAIADLPMLPNGATQNIRPYTGKAASEYADGLRGNLKACSNHLVTNNAAYVLKRYKHIPKGAIGRTYLPGL